MAVFNHMQCYIHCNGIIMINCTLPVKCDNNKIIIIIITKKSSLIITNKKKKKKKKKNMQM